MFVVFPIQVAAKALKVDRLSQDGEVGMSALVIGEVTLQEKFSITSKKFEKAGIVGVIAGGRGGLV